MSKTKNQFAELADFLKNYESSKKDILERKEELEAESKSFEQPIHVKASSIDAENRTAEFIATKEVKDRDGDIVQVSGISFDNFLKNPVVPFAHDYSSLPVGKVVALQVLEDQLNVKIQFPPKDISAKADEVFELVKAGFLSAVSIGFVPLDGAHDAEKNAFVISKSELLEVSIVPVPANQAAIIRQYSAKDVEEVVEEAIEEIIEEVVEAVEEKEVTEAIDKEVFEHNKEILKSYRKMQVELRSVLGIVASDDEKETVDEVFKSILAILKFVKDSCSTENQESETVKEAIPSETAKSKSIEDLSKSLLNL